MRTIGLEFYDEPEVTASENETSGNDKPKAEISENETNGKQSKGTKK